MECVQIETSSRDLELSEIGFSHDVPVQVQPIRKHLNSKGGLKMGNQILNIRLY